jgi:hypothetical protein
LSRTELSALDDALRIALEAHRRHEEENRFSTRAADKNAAESAMREAYDVAGLPPPQRFVWCTNPVALARTIDALLVEDTAGASVKSSVYDSALRRAGKQIDAVASRAARAEVWRILSDTPMRAASRAVSDAVEEAASHPLPNPFARLKRWIAEVVAGRRLRTPPVRFADRTFSTHDRSPAGIYRGFHDVCGLTTQTRHLQALWQALDTAGWIAPYERICILSARPSLLRFDPQTRLHAADGPALAFPDGWGIHAWKGVVLPAWMIRGERPITVEMIERQRDPVLRRCMIDILTPARFIRDANAVRVSSDETGTLWMKSWPDWDRWAAVEVVNGTPEPDGTFKRYILQVPSTVRTAREAVAWTYGMTEREYAQLSLRT